MPLFISYPPRSVVGPIGAFLSTVEILNRTKIYRIVEVVFNAGTAQQVVERDA